MSELFGSARVPSHRSSITRGVLLVVMALALIGCGSSTTGTSSPPSVAPPTPTASPSAAATPTEGASADPSASGGGPLAEAVVAALQAEPLVTHIDQEATVRQGATEASAGVVGDISGRDIALVLTLELAGQESTTELVAVGDEVRVRINGGAWQVGDPAAAQGSIDGLIQAARLVDDPSSLAHVGSATVDGRELQHLVAVGEIPYIPSSGGTGAYTTFDLYVEDDGTPVLLEGSFTATDANGASATGETRITYSDFGGPIEIELPDAPS